MKNHPDVSCEVIQKSRRGHPKVSNTKLRFTRFQETNIFRLQGPDMHALGDAFGRTFNFPQQRNETRQPTGDDVK